tara:strand:- start:60 stop:1517 length:1458 start_codon:yes stop_codon:yes gene_type:complete
MADSNPLQTAMTPPKSISLKLDNESTFQTKYKPAKGKSQLQLEKLYTKLYTDFRKSFASNYKGPKDKFKEKLWDGFKNKYGTLLASDSPVSNPRQQGSKYGDGKPLFKVRFKNGQISVGQSVQQQLRSWYTQIQSEGTPGTYYPLSKTKNQFFETDNQGRTLKQQIHHGIGVMELSSHLESTLIKLLSKKPEIRKQGQQEYRAFSRFTFKNNIILGDKLENYAGLAESKHINRDWAVHGYKAGSLESPGTSYYTTKQSGGSTFSDATTNILLTGRLKTPSGEVQLSKTNSGPNSFWGVAFGPYTDLSGEAGELSIQQARRFEAQETSRSKVQTKLPKKQGSGFRKNVTQIFLDRGYSPEKAAFLAQDAYESIRTGQSFLKHSYLGLIKGVKPRQSYGDYGNLFDVTPTTGNTFTDSVNLKPSKQSKISKFKPQTPKVKPISPVISTDNPYDNLDLPPLLNVGNEGPKHIYVNELTTLTMPIGIAW